MFKLTQLLSIQDRNSNFLWSASFRQMAQNLTVVRIFFLLPKKVDRLRLASASVDVSMLGRGVPDRSSLSER